jgi:hypothetical protein
MKLLLALAAIAAASGSTLPVEQYFNQYQETGICQGCLAPATGSFSFEFDVQQFDPAVGTLTAIDVSYSDSNSFYRCYNDSSATPGQPFSINSTRESASPDVQIDAHATVSTNYTTTRFATCNSTAGFHDSAHVTGSSSFYDPTFIGTGTRPVVFTDTVGLLAVIQPPVGFGVVAVIHGQVTGVAELDITYVYTPEPRQMGILMIALAAMAFFGKLRRRGFACACGG